MQSELLVQKESTWQIGRKILLRSVLGFFGAFVALFFLSAFSKGSIEGALIKAFDDVVVELNQLSEENSKTGELKQ